jgi:hypothetical protein
MQTAGPHALFPLTNALLSAFRLPIRKTGGASWCFQTSYPARRHYSYFPRFSCFFFLLCAKLEKQKRKSRDKATLGYLPPQTPASLLISFCAFSIHRPTERLKSSMKLELHSFHSLPYRGKGFFPALYYRLTKNYKNNYLNSKMNFLIIRSIQMKW